MILLTRMCSMHLLIIHVKGSFHGTCFFTALLFYVREMKNKRVLSMVRFFYCAAFLRT